METHVILPQKSVVPEFLKERAKNSEILLNLGRLSLEGAILATLRFPRGLLSIVSRPTKNFKYVHPKGTPHPPQNGVSKVEIWPNLANFQKFGPMCRLDAHTMELCGAPKGPTPPWIHAKYEPLTPLSY